MKNINLCPSMMCADFTNLKEEISNLEKAVVDLLHMDIMDGNFVNNFALGLEDYLSIHKLTKLPLDAHLMIEKPIRYVELFAKSGANLIYIHPEADDFPLRTLEKIKELGCKAGIAINPETSIESVSELLPYIDAILIMTVIPGFSGQKFIESMDKKIKSICSIREESGYNFEIGIDGNVSQQRIKRYSVVGVNNYILGTSAIFGKGLQYSKVISDLRKL